MDANRQPVISFAPRLRDSGFPLLRNTRTATLYDAKPETGTYSHHNHIVLSNGVIHAAWSNHMQDEDAPGQRVLMRCSGDDGRTWTDSVELFPPLDRVDPADRDGEGRRTQCANGFAVVDGVLYAFSEVFDRGAGGRMDGQGRLVRSIGSAGGLGDLFWLRSDAPAPKAGLPAWPAGEPSLVGRICAVLGLPGNELTWDFRHRSTHPAAADGHELCEPTPAWQLRDGTWCKLYRDLGGSNRNYAAFSHDGGATWTSAVRTDFPDANARSTAGVLPGGQVYVVSNISPQGRDPLAVSLSGDGLTFDRAALIRTGVPPRRYDGRWKGRGFQYPHSAVIGDALWVMYSVNKEDVQVTRIPLNELYSLTAALQDDG